eukprot:gnl/MRDRNA2_/MRDRNA2_17164_c0_seq1.p1 gnl/MRDRNA2_/MRDRNA2_17164_c0~~gnl/MRDRNA2_/MRDRNA2_17164_c0_seq1.p1  ORF type:complete len:165 (+),score=30.29 gnl/MRDRNA2_/MRDRNA2_17164_c0_seq1:58-495(+)
MTAKQGRGIMKDWLAAVKDAGLEDVLILDHPTEDLFKECKTWDMYISKLVEQVETPEFKDRQLLVFAHSHGCLEAYGFAHRLPKRVLKMYLVARRPPNIPVLDEVWGVQSGEALRELSDQQILQGLVGAWRNKFLSKCRREPITG